MAHHKELVAPSNVYGFTALFIHIIPLIIIYTLTPELLKHSLLWLIVLVPIIGLFIYKLTIVMHDCSHGTLYTSKKLNTLIGTFLGACTGIDFKSFKVKHRKHHLVYCQEEDPQGFHYLHIAHMTRVQFLAHLCKPLLGLNMRHVFTESLIYPNNLKRAFISGDILIIALTQIGIALMISSAGQNLYAIVLPSISALSFGLFFSQLRGVAEHGQSQLNNTAFTRSHRTDLLSYILFYGLNFNLHKEHHLYPYIPSHNLKKLRIKDKSHEALETIWHTLNMLMKNKENH